MIQTSLPHVLLQRIDEQFANDCAAAQLTRPPCNPNEVPIHNLNVLTTPHERIPVCCRPVNNFGGYTRALDLNMLGLSRSILRSITPAERTVQNINHSLMAAQGMGADERRFHVVKALLEHFGNGQFALVSLQTAIRRPFILQRLLRTSIPPVSDHDLQTLYARAIANVSVAMKPQQPPQFWKRVPGTKKPVVQIDGTSDLAKTLRGIAGQDCTRIAYESANENDACVVVDDVLYEHVPYPALSILVDFGALNTLDVCTSDAMLGAFVVHCYVSGLPCDVQVVDDLGGAKHHPPGQSTLGLRSDPYADALLCGFDAVAQVLRSHIEPPVTVSSFLTAIDGVDAQQDEGFRMQTLQRMLELTPRPMLRNEHLVRLLVNCTNAPLRGREMFDAVLDNCSLEAATAWGDNIRHRTTCVQRILRELFTFMQEQEERFRRGVPMTARVARDLNVRCVDMQDYPIPQSVARLWTELQIRTYRYR